VLLDLVISTSLRRSYITYLGSLHSSLILLDQCNFGKSYHLTLYERLLLCYTKRFSAFPRYVSPLYY
jgi:hypothetical protein